MAFGLMVRRPGQLPTEVTGFVGRDAELALLGGLLETQRLVTVTGPGGVGKTRLSLRAAALAASGYGDDGVCLVELSGLRDPELLPHTVAACLGLPQSDAQLDAVLDYLHDRKLLLILDTCEHLLDACAMLADAILRGAPGVTVLATSRQPLDVPGERGWAVSPLPVSGEAVELFAQRAAAVVAGFSVTDANRADVVRLCRRLDGIPLAIELAAVRLRALPLRDLADRLENRFRVLDGGLRTALPRHKTLRTAIEWSHDLCTPAEKALWARLSVFAGAFDLAAGEEVCADGELDQDELVNALIGLVDKSVLLREEEDGSTQYRLLDTLREFGAEQLAATGLAAMFQARHIDRYLAVAEHFRDHLLDDQLALYRALRHQHADIRAALEYALALPGRESSAARLVTALYAYWLIGPVGPEAQYWLARVLERFPDPSPDRALLLIIRCRAFTDAEADGREGLAIAEQLGEASLVTRGYLYLNLQLVTCGKVDEARRLGEIAQERLTAVNDQFGLLCLDAQMAQLHAFAGEPELTIERCERGLRRSFGTHELWQTSYLHQMAGLAYLSQGRYHESAQALCQALTMKFELGDTLGMALCLEYLAWGAVRQQRCYRGAWLLGGAATLIALDGGEVCDFDFLKDSHLQAEDEARDALGADQYVAVYRTGYDYPLDQMIPLVTSDADNLPQVATEPADAGAADPLTGREREIAALVAEGLSNREIAERLVISKRTVDAHVEHIYAKLGISSRVQLTNWLRL